MVSAASLAAMFFTLLLSLFLPVGLVIYYYRKYRFSLKAFFVGAAVFFLFQIVIRTPLLVFLSSQAWFSELSGNLFFSAVIIGGLTAGLFEECGRYLGFRFILPKELSWKNGLAYGLGHGGIEAIILVGLTYINNIVISLMINKGTFDQFVAPQLGAEASLIKSQLVNIPAHIFAAAGGGEGARADYPGCALPDRPLRGKAQAAAFLACGHIAAYRSQCRGHLSSGRRCRCLARRALYCSHSRGGILPDYQEQAVDRSARTLRYG